MAGRDLVSGLLIPPLPGWPPGPLRGRGSRPCPGLSHQGQTPHPHGCSHTRFQTWGWGRLGLSPGCRRVSPPGTCPLPATPPERMGLLRPLPSSPCHTWGPLSLGWLRCPLPQSAPRTQHKLPAVSWPVLPGVWVTSICNRQRATGPRHSGTVRAILPQLFVLTV